MSGSSAIDGPEVISAKTLDELRLRREAVEQIQKRLDSALSRYERLHNKAVNGMSELLEAYPETAWNAEVADFCYEIGLVEEVHEAFKHGEEGAS